MRNIVIVCDEEYCDCLWYGCTRTWLQCLVFSESSEIWVRKRELGETEHHGEKFKFGRAVIPYSYKVLLRPCLLPIEWFSQIFLRPCAPLLVSTVFTTSARLSTARTPITPAKSPEKRKTNRFSESSALPFPFPPPLSHSYPHTSLHPPQHQNGATWTRT